MRIATFLILLLCINLQATILAQSGGNDTGFIQMELVKEKIIVPVQIGGKTYKFLVDTGGILEISEKLQNEFNFNKIESTTIVDINRQEIELITVLVPEVKLGNWAFKNRKAIVSDLPSKYPYSCFELDGMIGRDFFDDVLLQFDFAANQFRLSEDTSKINIDQKHRTKLKLSSRGLPDVKLIINGKKEFVEFDSGSGDFYSPKTADAIKKLHKTEATNTDVLSFQGKFSFGVTMNNIKVSKRYMEKIESFQIANTTFNNFYSQFSKISAPRIGAGILKHGKVTLDYKNRWFYYEPYTALQKIAPFESFGFDVAIENRQYKVKWVLEKSNAHSLGLRSGNTIVSIDGVSTQNIQEDCEGYLNGYAFKKKTKIIIRYLDNEQNEQSISLSNKSYN